MKDFPEYFPPDVRERVIIYGVDSQDLNVYRVAKSGVIEEATFYSTFEEEQKGLRKSKKKLDLSNPSTYSTSCCLNKEALKYFLGLVMQSKPEARVIKGTTETTCGLSQITGKRTKKDKDMEHVDWWLYKDVFPTSFKFVEEEN
jgi:hypothetical protein